MSTISLARKSWQLQYVNAYIYRKYDSVTWDTTPIDVSRELLFEKIGNISFSLDPSAFDVGLFFSSKVTIFLENSRGKYSNQDNSRSIWSGFDTRDGSIFKLDCGYIDENSQEVSNIAFQGIIKSKTFEEDGDDNVKFDVFGFEQVFADIKVQVGSLVPATVSDTIFSILNKPEITSIITVNLSNIIPDNDIFIDSPSVFNNESIKNVLSTLLLITNSVAYIDKDRILHIKNRKEKDDIVLQLSSNSQIGLQDNILTIKRFTGEARIFNLFKTTDNVYYSESAVDLQMIYGINIKEINLDSLSNGTTIQSVLDRLVREFSVPKEEFEIETDYLGDAIQLLDKVYLEVFPDVIDTGFPPPICGQAICGSAVLTDFYGSIIIYGDKVYKVLKITHDLKKMITKLYIRNVGISFDDGYAASIGSSALCGVAICGSGEI